MNLPPWTTAKIALRGIWLIFIGALLIAALTFGIVQTIRLEGLHVWPVSVTGWIKTAEERQATIDMLENAQDLAAAKALVARIAQEAAYRDIAERIDEDAQDNLDSALGAADRFIAAGGMRRPGAAGSPRGAAGTGREDHAAEDPGRAGRAPQLDAAIAGVLDRLDEAAGEGTGGDFVLVSAADVRICTRNTVKAEAGHQLATQLQAASNGAK